MSYHIDLQHACSIPVPVSDELLISWAELPLSDHLLAAELTLRLVDEEEISDLNYRYRQQDKPTNVLAFPSNIPDNIELDFPLLGDLIICPAVLARECLELERTVEAHWAHIVIHGVLHLLGYDHINDSDTEIMQSLETKLLATLGFSDPYQLEGNGIE